MAHHNEIGLKGEKLATEFLIQNGYIILETNYRYKKAEIDIIAKFNNKIIVVEVKTRSSIHFGSPQDFVNKKKINLLLQAINNYIDNNNIDLEIRFDIIAITFKDSNYQIEHLEDAFCIFDL